MVVLTMSGMILLHQCVVMMKQHQQHLTTILEHEEQAIQPSFRTMNEANLVTVMDQPTHILHNTNTAMNDLLTTPTKNESTTFEKVSLITKSRPVTIVMYTMGELGNFLHFNAFSYGLYKLGKNEYGINTKIIFRRRKGSDEKKARRTTKEIRECFPTLQDFHLRDDFDALKSRKMQVKMLGEQVASEFLLKEEKRTNLTRLKETFQLLQSILVKKETESTTARHNLAVSSSDIIEPPFLEIYVMKNWELIDKYYDDYKVLFQLDEEKCCKLFPYHDEFVFVSILTTQPKTKKRNVCLFPSFVRSFGRSFVR